MKRASPIVGAVVTIVSVLAAGCHHGPPPDFAPDPGLVEQIREIRMAAGTRACPGETFGATYTAVLNDGGLVTFESRYDRKHPPRLHVSFLDRTSEQATPLEGGAWSADPDALTSAVTGFRLTASLKAKPSITTTAVLTPDYACMPHAFGFRGAGPGAGGPQVTVRLGILRSPFYDRLLVAGVEVEDAPPFYVFADANAVPPSDWLVIEARGARGARGSDGAPGTRGAPGASGCPGGVGGPGGNGGNGGPGGYGGRGGQITVVAPAEEPFLAGLVDANTPGGEAGPGGGGGKGGAGGVGGESSNPSNTACAKGGAGPAGRAGVRGADGRDGQPGNRAQILTVPARDVWGTRVPPALVELLNYRARR
jgi:hypothetical protein